MPAPKNNQYWKFRTFDGRKKKFTKKEWFNKFTAYFEFMKDRTWVKKEPIKSGEFAGKLIDVPTQTPMSIQGFCLFAGIDSETFKNYEKGDGWEEYFGITAWGRDVIETQQFEGAVVGAFNHSIIARKLGLTEKVDMTSKGEKIDTTINVKIHPPKE